ncbi:MAG TPA: RNA polymerase factor sigma-54 [Phycisphaerae bacterium]|nr:RNA polymerase factor sigma-54 [Phycisphaerae bacterium]
MRMEQRMKLAPRMIQSMEILQLPLMALEERIEQELQANPVLERKESEYEAPDLTPVAGIPKEATAPAEAAAPEAGAEEKAVAEISDREIDQYLQDQADWASLNRGSRVRSTGERDAKMDAMANTAARGVSLQEALTRQWDLVETSDRIRRAGYILIDWVTDAGLISDPLETIAEKMPADVTLEDLEAALPVLQQRLEPPGICARNVQECLLLQIDAWEREKDVDLTVPRSLVQSYLHDLEMNRLPQIARKSGFTIDQINQAKEFLKHLTLRPGSLLGENRVPTVTPDAVVERDEDTGEYTIRLTDGHTPRLYINEIYKRMAKTKAVDSKTREFIANNIRNARWLIESIEQRRNTLLRVLKVVVEAQKEFLEHGPQYMKPLPMIGVADQLGIHVGTVSRAVAEKYVQTPRGIFPLRMFFTGGTENAEGEAMSWDAVKAKLGEIIANEDKGNPLSDDEIVVKLKEQGIELARRTVAKYRKIAAIPPARRRKVF